MGLTCDRVDQHFKMLSSGAWPIPYYFDGIIGLGPTKTSVFGENSILKNLLFQKQIRRPFVGLYLKR